MQGDKIDKMLEIAFRMAWGLELNINLYSTLNFT